MRKKFHEFMKKNDMEKERAEEHVKKIWAITEETDLGMIAFRCGYCTAQIDKDKEQKKITTERERRLKSLLYEVAKKTVEEMNKKKDLTKKETE